MILLCLFPLVIFTAFIIRMGWFKMVVFGWCLVIFKYMKKLKLYFLSGDLGFLVWIEIINDFELMINVDKLKQCVISNPSLTIWLPKSIYETMIIEALVSYCVWFTGRPRGRPKAGFEVNLIGPPFCCNQCGRKYKLKGSLSRHLKLECRGNSSFF